MLNEVDNTFDLDLVYLVFLNTEKTTTLSCDDHIFKILLYNLISSKKHIKIIITIIEILFTVTLYLM